MTDWCQLKQRLKREDSNNFCPNGGCEFVHIQADVRGNIADCTNDAYSGDNIQITSGDWLNAKL